MSIVGRKTAELRAKLASIASEFEFWRSSSEAGGAWEKHHSQIRRTIRPIETALEQLSADIESSAASGAILSQVRRLEQMIIGLHGIWEFFRTKLLPRSTEPFKSSLLLADEFVWACYRPALEAIDELRKEPPLSFFETVSRPYMLSRDHSYLAIDNAHLTSKDAVELLKWMPIPVIGIPWYESTHLPGLLILAHEVGHHVEELGLTSDLSLAIDGAGLAAGHLTAWQKWSGEVFADIYATLASGPAFTAALCDFLAVGPEQIEAETRGSPDWGDYPTAFLRVLVSLAVLRRQFPAEAERIERSWRAAFPRHALFDWEDDCGLVADAILDQRYCQGAFALNELPSFGTLQQEHALQASAEALRHEQVSSLDARELVAAARFAFAEAPDAFDKAARGPSPRERIARQIATSRSSGVRAGGGRDARGAEIVDATKDRDVATGNAVYERLRGNVDASH